MTTSGRSSRESRPERSTTPCRATRAGRKAQAMHPLLPDAGERQGVLGLALARRGIGLARGESRVGRVVDVARGAVGGEDDMRVGEQRQAAAEPITSSSGCATMTAVRGRDRPVSGPGAAAGRPRARHALSARARSGGPSGRRTRRTRAGRCGGLVWCGSTPAMLGREAEGDGDVERLERPHLPVEPARRASGRKLSAQLRPVRRWRTPRSLQPAHRVVEPVILEVEPLADAELGRVARAKCRSAQLRRAVLAQQAHVEVAVVGRALRLAVPRRGGPGARQVVEAVPVDARRPGPISSSAVRCRPNSCTSSAPKRRDADLGDPDRQVGDGLDLVRACPATRGSASGSSRAESRAPRPRRPRRARPARCMFCDEVGIDRRDAAEHARQRRVLGARPRRPRARPSRRSVAQSGIDLEVPVRHVVRLVPEHHRFDHAPLLLRRIDRRPSARGVDRRGGRRTLPPPGARRSRSRRCAASPRRRRGSGSTSWSGRPRSGARRSAASG